MLNNQISENFYITPGKEFFKQNGEFNTAALIENDKETDGIEILVQMARQKKLDPWNIDLADLADKYMLHIAESKSNNLRITGRALFFLAVFLKIKSNVLVGLDPMSFLPENEPENNPDDENDDMMFSDDMYSYNDFSNVIPIDDIIQRRTSVKQNRKRFITLKDLIKQLEFYEKLDEKERIEKRNERASRHVRDYSRLSSADIVNMAKKEYIEQGIAVLKANLVQIFEKEEKVELNTLTLLGLDRVTAYVSLLFLTRDTDYELTQDKFYSEVYVTKGCSSQSDNISEAS